VLANIWRDAPFTGLYAHEETGNAFTYARDLKVGAWCQAHKVHWQEFAQFGVVRRLKSRNLWQAAWEQHMSLPQQNPHSLTFWQLPSEAPFVMSAPPHLQHNPALRQRGGRKLALATLHSFLNARSIGYRG
jgi:deoxyribodipyrimidine photo-lyase